MKKLLAVLILALLAPFANASIADGFPLFTWKAPALDINGAPLDLTGARAIKETRVQCGVGALTVAPGDFALLPSNIAIVLPPATSYQTIGAAKKFAPGTYTCAVQVKLVSGNGAMFSNAVTFTVPIPVVDPQPATNLTVQ